MKKFVSFVSALLVAQSSFSDALCSDKSTQTEIVLTASIAKVKHYSFHTIIPRLSKGAFKSLQVYHNDFGGPRFERVEFNYLNNEAMFVWNFGDGQRSVTIRCK